MERDPRVGVVEWGVAEAVVGDEWEDRQADLLENVCALRAVQRLLTRGDFHAIV